MRADIFPDLDLPVIYVAQPYGGMSPAQMEGYITYYYEYHFLYVNGIESVESKSIQNTSLLKLTFHAGTDMAEALARTIGYVNRARAFMPPGTVGPFIMRFDAGTVPVGYLVFSSDSRSLGEIQDLALNRVRPQFATLPGLTSPPPFGGSQRTIVIRVDPDRLRSYGMSPEEVIRAVSSGNVIMPSGSVNIGEETRISPMNSVVTDINDLLDLPIRTGAGTPVSIRDIGTVSDSTDIPTAYALVNGRRAVYIPVTKRPNASTLDVVNEVKANLGRFQALVPDDIKVSYELDQSRNVSASLQAVLREAALGALLTGLMVLVFLRDWRSAGIVVVTIPFALLAAVIALWGASQTINVMTLGGLALAVGILVDEATVAIENIHTHLGRGVPVAEGVLDASGEVVVPRLLAMLSVVAVFVPSFFMTGVSRSLFVPLSLAVGFSMIALPGELTPYQTVALYSRVTGFVKTIAVDRGSRVRAGQQLAALDAPELVAQKAEAQSKLQSAEAQLAAIRSKADATASTYEKLKAASATPGVVAGNDVVLAQKAVEADQGQIVAAQQNVEAARQALKSVSDMEEYLRIIAPFSGVVTERNVHPGALVGPTGGPGTATPILRIVESNRLRLVIPVPEAYTAGLTNGTSLIFTVAAYLGQTFTGTVSRISQSVDVATRTMAVELDVNNAGSRQAPSVRSHGPCAARRRHSWSPTAASRAPLGARLSSACKGVTRNGSTSRRGWRPAHWSKCSGI